MRVITLTNPARLLFSASPRLHLSGACAKTLSWRIFRNDTSSKELHFQTAYNLPCVCVIHLVRMSTQTLSAITAPQRSASLGNGGGLTLTRPGFSSDLMRLILRSVPTVQITGGNKQERRRSVAYRHTGVFALLGVFTLLWLS